MTSCYDLITIKLKNEIIQARPVAWDREIADGFGNDVRGNPVTAVEFHATCPYCGNLVHFTSDDIYKDKQEKDNVKCLMCRAGSEVGNVGAPKELKKTLAGGPKAIESKVLVFIDPIADGLFDLEVDHDLLKELDSTKAS